MAPWLPLDVGVRERVCEAEKAKDLLVVRVAVEALGVVD